jgi:hypothetical protein
MASENPTWGEERIANELSLKLNIQVSPRTVGKYLRRDHPVRTPDPKQRWRTFIRNHAKVMVACDFFVVITAAFRLHHRRDQIPSGPPLQRHGASQGGMDTAAVPRSSAGGHPYRFVIHDRHRIFSEAVDQGLSNLGVRVLRTPVRAPKANSVCERLGGCLRRECLDFLDSLSTNAICK